MNLDIDFLIDFFKKNSKEITKSEFTEQDTASGGAGSGGGSGKKPRAWASNASRGPANPIDSKSVWKSNVKRGPANQLYFDI